MSEFSLLSPLLLGLLLLGPAAAQTAPAMPARVTGAPVVGPVLSLETLLPLLREAPGWRAADLTYRAAELSLQSARTRAGLTLSVGGSASAVKVPWDSGEWSASSAVTLSAALSVLPWSPALEAVRSAERALGAASTELRGARAALTLQLAQAYAGARSAAASLALAEAQAALAAQGLQVAQAQRAQNLLSQENLLDRQGAQEQAQAGVAQARRALEVAAGQLRRLLGRDVPLPTDPQAYAPLGAELLPAELRALAGAALNEADLLRRALVARPEVVRAQVGLSDAQIALEAARRAAGLPDVTASVQAGQLSDAQGRSGRTISAGLGVRSGVLSAQASLPLRDTGNIPNGVALNLSGTFTLLGRTEDQAVAQARLGAQQAALALDTARQAVELEVRTRLAELQNDQGALTALSTALTRAQTALDSARARLSAGLATPLEVRQAELGLLQARTTLNAALAQVTLAALALALATGQLDPLLLTPLPVFPPTVSPLPGGRS
ncbi:TolC family protein [Deinococcus hohokamensis]|uniref:TolC family protein n=1 Tax=Deinococcus hohokamensis TaxID=309883 RepID=A0ABV9I995_9DEIO